MKYAIVRLGASQFKVVEGQILKSTCAEPLELAVLAFCDDRTFEFGTPTLSDVLVEAKVVGEERSDKIRVARFRAKTRYRTVYGHRQPLRLIKIEKISKVGEKTEAEMEKKSRAKSAKTKKVVRKDEASK